MKMVVVDVDYIYNKRNEPVIRIYGKVVSGECGNNEGCDMILHVVGFEPYIYLDSRDVGVVMLKSVVEKELKSYLKRVEIVKKYRSMGYQIRKKDMLKLIFFNPRVVPEVRKILVEKIEEISDNDIYEADILFRDRFMIDMGIDGMSVIEFKNYEVLGNYGVKCDRLYICRMGDVKVVNDEVVSIEY